MGDTIHQLAPTTRALDQRPSRKKRALWVRRFRALPIKRKPVVRQLGVGSVQIDPLVESSKPTRDPDALKNLSHLLKTDRYKHGEPKTMVQEVERRISATVSGWDCPLLL